MLLADEPISNWRDAVTRSGQREAHDEQVAKARLQMARERETPAVPPLEGVRPLMPESRIVSVVPEGEALRPEERKGA